MTHISDKDDASCQWFGMFPFESMAHAGHTKQETGSAWRLLRNNDHRHVKPENSV